MSYLFHILAAAASLALPRVGASPLYSLALLGLWALPYGLAVLARRAARGGAFKRAALYGRATSVLPVVTQAAAWSLLGWSRALASVGLPGAQVGTWPGPGLLLTLLPFLLGSATSIDATARLHGRAVRTVQAIRAFQARMFVSGLAPIAGYLVLSGCIGRSERLRIELEEVSLSSAGFTLLLLVAAVFLLPRLLAALWSTAPIPRGPQRELLEELASRAGFRARDLLVWRTGGQVANAAIVGFTPRTRVVLFTDALLRLLDPIELAAVFGHEMGHARRRHALVFGAFTLGIFLLAETLAEELASEDPNVQLSVFALALGVWAVSFRSLSRRAELEADLESLELVGASAPLVRALSKVTPRRSLRRDSWRHLSTEKRARFLHAVEADPAQGLVLHRGLRRWSWVATLVLLLALAAHGVALAHRWPGERLAVDLRLGRYAAAADRMAGLGNTERSRLDPRLLERVRVAARLPETDRAPERLEAEARRAFAAGKDHRAALLLELAALRGRADLEALVEALEAGLSEAGAVELPEEWRRALAERLQRGG